jgi:hypothetical protein
MVVVMMVVVVVVMMVMHLTGHWSGGRRRRGGFLRNGVPRQADGDSRCGDKTLDHGKAFLLSKRPPAGLRTHTCAARLNSE